MFRFIEFEPIFKIDENDSSPFCDVEIEDYKVKFNNPFELVEVAPFDFVVSEYKKGKHLYSCELLSQLYGKKIDADMYEDEVAEKLGTVTKYQLYKFSRWQNKEIIALGFELFEAMYESVNSEEK